MTGAGAGAGPDRIDPQLPGELAHRGEVGGRERRAGGGHGLVLGGRVLCRGAHATTATWLSMRLNRSSHDLTKFWAPSDWSVAASAPTSTPADSNCANVASASPPSAAIGSPTRPWSSKARSVDSGIVLIVCGARRPSMYIVSGRSGSLVLVLAHSSRCTRAPAFASRCQRSESISSRYA